MNDSNVISSVGRGTVWKWSNSQIDSNPSRSACRATSVVRRQASSGSQPSYSPTQPWGTIAPIFIGAASASSTTVSPPNAIAPPTWYVSAIAFQASKPGWASWAW